VWLFDDARNRIEIVRTVGYPADILARWSDAPADTPLLTVVRAGELACTSSRLSDARFDASLMRDFGDGAGFVAPMAAGGRVLGCIGGSYDHVREFSPEEREFILTLATHCAQSFERARLFEAERAARAAADAARRQLETVLEQLPVGCSVVGADWSVMMNAQAADILGTEPRTTVPPVSQRRSHFRRLDGTRYEDSELPIARALAGKSVAGEEMLITRTDDGRDRRLRVNAVPVRDPGGRVRSAVAIFSDITEQHRVEEELRASERRYRAVLRATNDVIWEFDPNTGVLHWSDALERIFGHPPELANQHPRGGYAWWMEHIHPDDRAAIADGYHRARHGAADAWNGEYRFRRADGAYVPTLDRCVFQRDESGRVVRIVGAISDVSEQHRLLDELRAAVLVRDDFLSAAGHELRTPLAALSAQLLGLKQLPLDDARRALKLAAAERQVARLTTLVDELLNVSRIVHGKLRLERESVDLAAVVHEAAARLADDFQRGGTPLVVDAPAPVVGRWDRLRIDLVVTNLLTNALRYGERRPVRIAVATVRDKARVVVEDQGLGIRREDQERIFERFVRAVPSQKFGGLGVGLWLSRQIVDAHGGRLTVASEAGQGSRFTVELPSNPP
jgi:PAS domain S-box-containing protein